MISLDVEKQGAYHRKVIPANEILAITLRYLVNGYLYINHNDLNST